MQLADLFGSLVENLALKMLLLPNMDMHVLICTLIKSIQPGPTPPMSTYFNL